MGNCNSDHKTDNTNPRSKSRTLTNQMHEDSKPKVKVSIEDFVKIRALGKGAYGTVFLTRNSKTNRAYAMKILAKKNLTKDSTIRHIKEERVVLEKVKCPYLVKLKFAFQDPQNLYLIVNYMDGGELFYHLRKVTIFPLEMAKFYAAEILMGVKYLHDNNIIYRDLKPENVLLNKKGHIKLVDFGLSKIMQQINDKAHSLCGTPEYLAPEILLDKSGYDQSVDWWSFGCIVYEMLMGFPPFYNKNKKQMMQDRITKKLVFPQPIDPVSKEFISKLLSLDPQQRLGYNGSEEVMNHPFFDGISFGELLVIKPPYSFDRKDFNFFDPNAKDITMNIKHNGTTENGLQFPGFTYEGQVTIDKSTNITQLDF